MPVLPRREARRGVSAKLLALAEEQRRALDEVLYELSDDMLATKPKQQARAALATNLDALLAEARELGIDATTPAMAPETDDSRDSEIAYNNDDK